MNGPDSKDGADDSSQMMLCGSSSNGNRNGNGGRGMTAAQICVRRRLGGVRAPQQRCSVEGRWRLLKAAAEAKMVAAIGITLYSSSVIVVGCASA